MLVNGNVKLSISFMIITLKLDSAFFTKQLENPQKIVNHEHEKAGNYHL